MVIHTPKMPPTHGHDTDHGYDPCHGHGDTLGSTGVKLRHVMLVAGGTGGHVFPAQAVAQVLRASFGCRVTLLTDGRGARFGRVQEDGFSDVIQVTPSRGTLWNREGIPSLLRKGLSWISLAIGSFFAVLRHRPDAVWGFGGKETLFPLLAAWMMRLPRGIHQSDCVFGRANRVLSSYVPRISMGYAQTCKVPPAARSRICIVGVPVRSSFTPHPLPCVKELPLRIAVIGGSQGASFFSDSIAAAFSLLSPHERTAFHLIHQCPESHVERVSLTYQALGVSATVASFFHDMPELLRSSHMVIGRAGASSIAEIIAVGRPALLIPLPSASDDHQTANASLLVTAGAGWMCPQSHCSGEFLTDLLRTILHNPNQLEIMASRAADIRIGNAAERLVSLMCERSP